MNANTNPHSTTAPRTTASAYDRLRAGRHCCIPAMVVLGALAAFPAHAEIRSVHIGTTTWQPEATGTTGRTPLFRGANTIRVVGTNPGITLAAGFELRDGPCPSPIATGRVVAVGSIQSRSVRDYAGYPSLTLTLPLTQAHALGNYCGHISYPAGNLSRDTFTVRILSRGLVSSVTATNLNAENEATVTWSGVGMNPASINMNLTPLPGVSAGAVSGNGTTVSSAPLKFAYCGQFYIYPTMLFDRNAPTALIVDGAYRYQGTKSTIIFVTQNCTMPSVRPASTGGLFCIEDPNTATRECPPP